MLVYRNSEFFSYLGLSVLEGGPCPEFLDQALNHSENSEYWDQFRRGLNRVGLLTVSIY